MRKPIPNYVKRFFFENSNYYIRKDKSFRAFNRVDLAKGGNTNILIENPTGSGTSIFLRGLEYLTTQDITVDVYKNVDFTGGTSVSPRRLNIGGDEVADANVFTDVDYTGGVREFTDVVTAASSTPQDPASNTGLTDLVILSEEDTNIVVDVTDTSGNSSTVILRGRWIED